MKRTNKFKLKPTKEQEKRLRELANNCSKLWNEINYKRRKAFFEGEIIYDELKKLWYAFQPVEVEPLHQPLGNKKAYCDLGGRKGNCNGKNQGQNYWLQWKLLVSRMVVLDR
ncbi:MAG: helix-turn-helix domain-containing protein [Candidatus Heimdallarchaeaceae archaeon]